MVADPVERHQDADEAGHAVGVGDLDAHEARARGDPAVAALGVGAGDHAGHVRAVAERVEPAPVRIPGVVGEVGAADELARAVERADPEHAGVDQGDVHAGAGEPGLLGAGRRADQVHRGAGTGRAVVGLGEDRRDRVGDRVLHDADGVLAGGDRIGDERRAGGVLRGVGDRLVGDLVGRLAGGDLRGRRGDVDRRGARQRERRVTGDAADRGRPAQPRQRGGGDPGGEAVDDRDPAPDVAAEPLDEPRGGALRAGLGADDHGHAGRGLRPRGSGAERAQHEEQGEQRTHDRAGHPPPYRRARGFL